MSLGLGPFRLSLLEGDYTPAMKYILIKENGGTYNLRHVLFHDPYKYTPFCFLSGDSLDPRQYFRDLIRQHHLSVPVEHYPPVLRTVFHAVANTTYLEIPEDYAQAIADELVEQSRLHNGEEFHVRCYGRVECELPQGWTNRLVAKLLDAGLYVQDDATTTLEHPRLYGTGRHSDGRLKVPPAS